MDVAGQSVSLSALLALGVIVGIVAGMFGVGGGFLLTPLLSVLVGIPLPIAVGTGMCQMVGTATVALLRHRKLRQGEPRFGILMIPGALVGVTAGARVVAALEAAGEIVLFERRVALVTIVLYVAFIGFLLASAAALSKRAQGNVEVLGYVRRGPLARIALPPLIDLPTVPMSRISAPVVAYVGLFLGFLSGLLGVGGGVALMPILLYGFGFPIRHAAGTGIVVLLVTAIAGTLAHAQQGHVHLGVAMVLLIGASISAQIGAMLTSQLPARVLRRGFVGLVLFTVVTILYDLWRQIG